MEFSNNLWEYKESINRLQATPQEVEKVKKQLEYSNRLVKAHNVMKVLDLPDNQDNPIRQILLKQDDNTLVELSKKSQREIQSFLIQAKENGIANIDIKNDEKFSKLKSSFPQSVLDKNPNIAKMLDNKDFDGLLSFLKSWNNLKSIIDQLWWADKNNPQYQEFKNTLIWLDSGFESYFQDLEKISSWNSLNANEVISWIEKDSWWMIDIDLNSNTPTSKLSLAWSSYSFDEEIDKKVLLEIMWEWEKELAEIQNSFAVLKGLYKPFDWLLKNIKENWWNENLKEKIKESILNFSKNSFDELDEVYEKMGIKSDIQIKEFDISSFAEVKTVDELKEKVANFKDKMEKIKSHLVELQAWITNKYQTKMKNVLSLKSEQKEKQVEVLNFMKDSGFDLIPKEISDKFIWEIQANTLNIPWLDLNIKNIDLKNWNFWESNMHKWEGLNIHSKTNMLKFMNKMISWDINEPLQVESIANGSQNVSPDYLQSRFLEAWIVDSLWWKEWKISENLSKQSAENK